MVTRIVTELVNITSAPWQEEVNNRLDFSTGTYTSSTTAKNSFLPSLGGSILDSLPPVLESGPWIEKPPVPAVPDWEDLEKVDGEDEKVEEEGWTDYYQWENGPGEVYEIEIEQSLPTSPDSPGPSSTIFRPGLVIDDPSLIQSIVTDPESNYSSDLLEEEEVEMLEEVQEVPEESVPVGTIEEVPILEYSNYFPISSYQEESQTFEFDPYDDLNTVDTEYADPDQQTKSEPEIHCDLSILLSGISCTFNILDKETPAQPPPYEIIEEPLEEVIQENNIEDLSSSEAPRDEVFEDDIKSIMPEEEVETEIQIEADEEEGDQSDESNEDVQTTTEIVEKTTSNNSRDNSEVEVPTNSSTLEDGLEDQNHDDSKEVRHVVQDLAAIEENADILQILIDQLQELGNKNTRPSSAEMSEAKPTVETIKEEEETVSSVVTTSTTVRPTSEAAPVPELVTSSAVSKPKEKVCGLKGGQYVEKSYGRAATKYILPLLIDSWVFGKDPMQRARYEDTEGRISGGKVTSTVLYCWVAAILTQQGEFVCTGTLVAEDLVITSGSCINL